jgi:transcriptional regulator of met regulon
LFFLVFKLIVSICNPALSPVHCQMSEGQRAILWTEILKIEQKIVEKNKQIANSEATIQQWAEKRQEEQKPVITGWVPALVREPIPQKPDLQKNKKNRENEAAEKVAKKAQVSARSPNQLLLSLW